MRTATARPSRAARLGTVALLATVGLLTAACSARPAGGGPRTADAPSVGFPGDVTPGQLRWGAAIDGNGDPIRHEAPAAHPMGLRRTFFRWNQPSLVPTARADVAAGRLPWVSVKTPGWGVVASGAVDAELDAMLRGLDSVGGPVWFTVHHEPEGGGGVNSPDDPGGPAAWRAMQVKVRERMNAVGTRNVAFAPILMAWTFDPRSGRNPEEWFVPGIWDFYGIDYYVYEESHPAMAETAQWRNARAFLGARGLPIAVGEWGNRGTDWVAAEEMSAFHRHAVGSAFDGRGSRVIGMAYFDSALNSPSGSWQLQGAPLARFGELLRAPESVLVRER